MREDFCKSFPNQDRKTWTQPTLKRLDAGSAELEVGATSDGPNDVS